MNMSIKWTIDPKTKEPSVSLSILVASFILVLIAIGLNLAKLTENTSAAMELFYASSALYFGRKLNFGGKQFNSDNTPSTEESTKSTEVK